MRVVDAIAAWFETIGVQHYFGYAGGAIWPFMDALIDHPALEGIQSKHESHAVHMADVYYRMTGRLAPVLVTKGPGLMNCAGGVASAMHDTSAVMIIAGCGSTHFYGKAGMQEMYYKGFEDAESIFKPITKGTWVMVRPDTVIDVLNTAYRAATSGRPGPVFVQVPFDIQLAEVSGEIESALHRTVTSKMRADSASVARVVELLGEAQRPVIVAGGGVVLSPGGSTALRTVAERLQIPVASTLMAKGVLPENHPLSVGTVGRSGTDMAAQTTRTADLIVAVGARFSDNHSANWREKYIYDVPTAKVVQVDVDAAEISRNYPVEVGMLSDAAVFFDDLGAALGANGPMPDRSAWLQQVDGYRTAWVDSIQPLLTASSSPIHPARLCHEIGEALGPDGRVFIDVTDMIQYAEPYMTIRNPGAWVFNGGMAEMGWAASGVLGAVAADRSRPAVVLCGDGGFNMVSQILATAVEYDLPAVWVIVNNHELGIERKGSNVAFKRNHPWVSFTRKDTGEPYNPDYTALALANGALGERVEKAEDFAPALQRALASGRPYVIDTPIDPTVPTYFATGIDRAYPAKWAESYPAYNLLSLKK